MRWMDESKLFLVTFNISHAKSSCQLVDRSLCEFYYGDGVCVCVCLYAMKEPISLETPFFLSLHTIHN